MISGTKDTGICNYGFEGIADEADFNTAEVRGLPKNCLKRCAGVGTRRVRVEECVKM